MYVSEMISSVLKDYIKIEKYDSSDASSIYDNQKDVGEQSNVELFRKYLLSKGQHKTLGKRVEQQYCDQSIRNLPNFSAMQLHEVDYTSRPSTLLEQHLLPVLESNAKLPSLHNEKSLGAQLTIFYAGGVSVYDNVSNDQAQAIMLLAGGTNVSPPPVAKICTSKPKDAATARRQQNHQPTNSPSLCKLQSDIDLPLARKISLQHFLEKRRTRITNRSPYPTPSGSRNKHEGDEEEDENSKQITYQNSNGVIIREDINFSKSPFPSRLGYFFPTNKTS